MKITDILQKYNFESKRVEYKQRLIKKNYISWLKTIAAFANCEGGDMIVGVNNDRTLGGFLADEIDKEVLNINN